MTCVDWDMGNSRLYSGSKDKHVVAWNVDTGESIRCSSVDWYVYAVMGSLSSRKWKVDKTAVQCLRCYGDGSVLLTAGRTIKMWSLEDCTVIKVSYVVYICRMYSNRGRVLPPELFFF